MSVASAWAETFQAAIDAKILAQTKRPGPSAEFYVSGVGRVRFAVGDNGRPLLVIDEKPHEVAWSSDRENLLSSAAWLLATFGEAPTA